jgi:hypothetical protein
LCWSLIDGNGTDGPNIALLGTAEGAKTILWADAVYVDGCQSGEIHLAHAEHENTAGIEVGKTQLTFGLDLWARMANVITNSTGKTVVQFDSNAGTGNIVELAESQDSGASLINDLANGITITSTAAAKSYGPYVQPMGGLTAYIQSPLTVTQASTFSGNVNVTGTLSAASPAFTGTPTAPTPSPGDNSTKIATTAFVVTSEGAYAPLASPSFTGGISVAGGETISTGSVTVSSSTADIALGNTATHITGVGGTTDVFGQITLTVATSNSVSFSRSFASGSRCTLAPTTDPSVGCGAYWVTSSTSAVTAHVHTACTIVFVYHCYGF